MPQTRAKMIWIFMFHFLEGCKVSFSFMSLWLTVILPFLISIENFYLVWKQSKENFVEKFVDSGIVKTCDELDLWLSFCLLSSEDGLHEVQMNHSIQRNLFGNKKNRTEESGSNLHKTSGLSNMYHICHFDLFSFNKFFWRRKI